MSTSYVEERLRELGVPRGRLGRVKPPKLEGRPPSSRPARKEAEQAPTTGGFHWRGEDLQAIERLVTERRNVLICGSGSTGKTTLAASFAGLIAEKNGKDYPVHCVLERYPPAAFRSATNLIADPDGTALRASLRRSLPPLGQCLVLDEIYTCSGAHALLSAWKHGITGIGSLVVTEAAQGDCLGRLAVLEEHYLHGFTASEVLRIYRAARPVIVRTVHPGTIELLGDELRIPPWMKEAA